MKLRASVIRDFVVLAAILVALVVLFGSLSQRFFTPATFSTIANRIPALALVATGMTLVLIIGGIDLSVGSVLALGGAVLGVALVDWQWSFAASAALSLAVGALAGLLNGALTVGLRVPSFIVTLGMLEMARGLAYLTTNSQTKYLGKSVEGLARPILGLGISGAFLLALLVMLVAQLLLSRTVLGRYCVAVGTNEAATRLAGINPGPVKVAIFAFAGALAGLGAVCNVARLGASDPNAGAGIELAAIAAAVIGGTSLMGGRGSVIATFFGVLIIATLETGLAQIGATEPVKRMITGLVIVLASVADAWRQRSVGRPVFSIFSRLLRRGGPPAASPIK